MPKYTIEFEDDYDFYKHTNAITDCETKTELLDEIYNLSRSVLKHGGNEDQLAEVLVRVRDLSYEGAPQVDTEVDTLKYRQAIILIVVFVIAIAALITQYFILTH